ncbi:uncharacterized protein LOC125492350 isoform X2 [Beta vulgaris subsp. vulgaris]|uniref:uncharacterized protein LOC125492350 isoform X2 n=1 Tax=Beta vulgaris subsp. vulgaris TaxID=3555 RepID=UPI002546DFCF|nr:uncharacterized protein LOC125492350 isoform X2 [Beta vulgaris subsp. vulgaris]
MSYGLFVDHFELMNLSTKIAQFGVRSYELRLAQVQHYCCTLCCVAAVVGLFALLLPLFWYSFPYEGRCWSMYMEINYEVRAIVVIQNVELFEIVSSFVSTFTFEDYRDRGVRFHCSSIIRRITMHPFGTILS